MLYVVIYSLFRSIGIFLLASILLTLTSNLALSTFQSMDAIGYYYWLKPGVFFKYKLSTNSTIPEDQPPTHPIQFLQLDPNYISISLGKYLEDEKFEIITGVITRSLYITWTVLDIVDHFMIIEYRFEVPYGWIYHEESNSLTRFVFNKSYTYIVDLETLDTYTYENGGIGRWVGEWPYLLKPEATTKNSIKLMGLEIFLQPVRICLVSVDETTPEEELNALLRFIEYVNQTVYRLSNGTKIYTGVIREDGRFDMADMYALFTLLSPPPYIEEYRFGNIVITPDRIVYSNTTASFRPVFEEPRGSIIYEDYRESFNELYNSSKRPILFLETPFVSRYVKAWDKRVYLKWMMMIDPEGDVYAIIPFREVLYDAITGVLLKVKYESGTELYGIPRFKNHGIGGKEEILQLGAHYYRSRHRSLELSLILIDTNISFERPIFGLTPETRSKVTPTTRTTGESLYNTLVIVVSITIPLLAITYLYLRRAERIRRV